jgi:hypothetical protein
MPAPAVPVVLPAGVPFARSGFIVDFLLSQYTQANFFGLTGTYYDKDLTDVVFRYDFSYKPKFGVFESGPGKFLLLAPGKDQGKWTDEFTGIIAFDRPTYIPLLSKQHTFIVSQYVLNWYPGVDGHTIPFESDAQGKMRKFQNLAFIAAADWLFDGRIATTNSFVWDIDDNVGELLSTNTFRYTSNTLMALNAVWYLGRSGRFTDPFNFSRNQRINELEARFTYEL